MARPGPGEAGWELVDPCPDVHALFIQFDARFFWKRLGAVHVRWSKRMYSCAGVCRYEGRGGMCDIALSEPLLKLRPRKDLIETLLHEMIHAFLFLTNKDRDRDGHGPIFQSHMHRINKEANINITIYHDFHDEVLHYKTHWWRCNGPCQSRKPFFGTVRRSSNRAPGPNDFWWQDHQRSCGGTFIKIKEPENKKKTASKKPKENITKYTNPMSNIKSLTDIPSTCNTTGKIVIVTKTTTPPKPLSNVSNKNSPQTLWPQIGTLETSSDLNDNIRQTVRNHWANKSLNGLTLSAMTDINKNNKRTSSDVGDFKSPPPKINKIQNYFPKSEFKTPSPKSNITTNYPNSRLPKVLSQDNIFPSTSNSPKGLTKEVAESLLKDIYGEDFTLYRQKTHDATPPKLVAVKNSIDSTSENLPVNSKVIKAEPIVIGESEPDSIIDVVNCPLCKVKVKNSEINDHLDICLLRSENEIMKEEDEEKDTKEMIDLTCVVTEMSGPCPVCNKIISGSLDDHLDICLAFFKNSDPFCDEATTSSTPVKKEIADSVIELIDDDDIDESSSFNKTGTMYPCPCCMTMVEADLMNRHIDECLNKIYFENCQISSA